MSDARLMRTKLLLGEAGIRRLANSKVMIVGLGAVGGYALEAIARSGVGHIVLVDFDKFEESNINRQILALSSTIGKLKTEVAAARVKEINPNCKVEIYNLFVDENTIQELLLSGLDFVVDAIDSLNSKCCLIEALWRCKIPFISSMGAALKTDASAVKVCSLNKTESCGLAKQLRQRLRRKEVNLSEVACVFSSEKTQIQAYGDAEKEGERRPMGALPTITGIFGLMCANYVIRHLSKAD